MNIICFLKGHKHDYATNDMCCERCGKHYYFSSIDADPGCRYEKWYNCYEFTLWHLYQFCRIRLKWFVRKYFAKCDDCGKTNLRFGKETGDHSNCLPF